jgi:CHASE3 domain sensor protein
MRSFKRILAAGLTVLTCLQALPARADQGVVGTADLDRALRARVDAETTARDAIKDLLARDEVREVAGRAGLDLKRANAAVDTLQGAELQEMSARAAAADAALAGGKNITITISVVALLLIIIIVILLAK